MGTIEVTRERSDRLARQIYGFQFDPVTSELVLDSYKYQERLSKMKRWVTVQQWLQSAADMYTGNVELKSIPLDPAIQSAARALFAKQIKVVKESIDE